jgi:hypothetical protein
VCQVHPALIENWCKIPSLVETIKSECSLGKNGERVVRGHTPIRERPPRHPVTALDTRHVLPDTLEGSRLLQSTAGTRARYRGERLPVPWHGLPAVNDSVQRVASCRAPVSEGMNAKVPPSTYWL